MTESSSRQPDKSGSTEEGQVSPGHQSCADKESQAKKENFLSVFRPDPTSFFAGPLEKEFAKSFYNRSAYLDWFYFVAAVQWINVV